MKILYLNYSPSTIQFTRTYGLADGLRSLGNEVIVVNMHRKIRAQLKTAPENKPIAHSVPKVRSNKMMKIIPRPFILLKGEIKRFLGNLSYLPLEFKLFLKYKPDIIVIRPMPLWSYYLSSFILRKKLVYDTDGPLLELFQNEYHDFPKVYLKFERFFIRHSKAICVVSEEMKRYYGAFGGDINRIFVCPNGIDPKRFKYDMDASEIREKYHTKDKITIGFMGNLAPWHGLPGLLNIFPSLAEKYENIRLLLVGLKLDWDNLPAAVDKCLIEFKDKIICTGKVPFDLMPTYLKAINIFILPYPQIEFFYFSPLKLFESMGVGCTIVGADIGQISEVIRDNKDGLLFPPGDYDIMKDKIEKLINNPELRSRLGKAAAERVHTNYQWKNSAEGIIKAFEYSYGEKRKTKAG